MNTNSKGAFGYSCSFISSICQRGTHRDRDCICCAAVGRALAHACSRMKLHSGSEALGSTHAQDLNRLLNLLQLFYPKHSICLTKMHDSDPSPNVESIQNSRMHSMQQQFQSDSERIGTPVGRAQWLFLVHCIYIENNH